MDKHFQAQSFFIARLSYYNSEWATCNGPMANFLDPLDVFMAAMEDTKQKFPELYEA